MVPKIQIPTLYNTNFLNDIENLGFQQLRSNKND